MSESEKITYDAVYKYLINIKNEIDSVEAADANLETLINNLNIIKFAMPFSMQKGKLLRNLKKFPKDNLSISDNPSELEVERAKKYFEEIISLYEKFFHVLDKSVKKEEYSNAKEKTSKNIKSKKKENRNKLCIVMRDIFHKCIMHAKEYFSDVTGAASSNRKVAEKNASGNNIQKLVDGFFLTHDKELLAEIIKISQKKNAPLNELIDENYIKDKMQPFYSFDDEEQIIECTFVFIYYNDTIIQTGDIDSLKNKCKSDPKFLPKGWGYTKKLKFLFHDGKLINGVVRLDAPASDALSCAVEVLIIISIIINTKCKLHWYLPVGKDKIVEKKYFGQMASALDKENIKVRHLKQNVNKVNLLTK